MQPMAALPVLVKAAIGAFVLASIWWAIFGPPPDRRDVGSAKLWALTSVVFWAAALYALARDRSSATLLFGAGILTLCVAVWHARGDDGGGGGGGGDDGDGPLDWDEFDRARRDWDRPLIGA
jgi:hypothetical protein